MDPAYPIHSYEVIERFIPYKQMSESLGKDVIRSVMCNDGQHQLTYIDLLRIIRIPISQIVRYYIDQIPGASLEKYADYMIKDAHRIRFVLHDFYNANEMKFPIYYDAIQMIYRAHYGCFYVQYATINELNYVFYMKVFKCEHIPTKAIYHEYLNKLLYNFHPEMAALIISYRNRNMTDKSSMDGSSTDSSSMDGLSINKICVDSLSVDSLSIDSLSMDMISIYDNFHKSSPENEQIMDRALTILDGIYEDEIVEKICDNLYGLSFTSSNN